MKREAWSVERLLTTWGLYVCGGNFSNPWLGGSNGEIDANQDEAQAAHYVEFTRRFPYAEPALRWLYVEGHETLAGFGGKFPWESWEEYRVRLRLPKASPTWQYDPVAEYQAFLSELARRVRVEPFIPTPSLREFNPWVGDQVEKASGKKTGTFFRPKRTILAKVRYT